jgi:hypothetical protein
VELEGDGLIVFLVCIFIDQQPVAEVCPNKADVPGRDYRKKPLGLMIDALRGEKIAENELRLPGIEAAQEIAKLGQEPDAANPSCILLCGQPIQRWQE